MQAIVNVFSKCIFYGKVLLKFPQKGSCCLERFHLKTITHSFFDNIEKQIDCSLVTYFY